MSGTLSVGLFEVTTDSIGLNQVEDVVITSETHNDLIRFNENATDPTYTDGFVNKSGIQISEVDDINVSSTPPHNSLFAYNDNAVISSVVDGWIDRVITDILTSFQVTIEGLINIELSLRRGRQGNPALSDMVAFTGENVGTTTNTGSTSGIVSHGNNNILHKRGPTDENFVYLQTLSLGEKVSYSFPAGTIYRSSKGINGFSSPAPLSFGLASMSSNYFRFFAFRNTVFAYVTSAGLESVVTLFASDETTIVDGPHTIAAYGSVTLTCNANDEFVIISTNNVYCGTASNNNAETAVTLDQRIIPPMVCEMITYNRFNEVTAQFSNTLVRWYRQNGETGSVTVNAGTPASIYAGNINEDVGATNNNAGSTQDYQVQGWLILRSDKPISAFSGADGSGGNATPGWPIEQLGQIFPAAQSIDNDPDGDRSSVNVCSPYEGTATVYLSDGTIVTTFPILRGVTPATSPEDQLYPAAGQWQPIDNSIALWDGWIETNVPCNCVMNYSGDPLFTGNYDETTIPGTTPDEIRAEIVKDAGGLYRRRDISATGVETWNIC